MKSLMTKFKEKLNSYLTNVLRCAHKVAVAKGCTIQDEVEFFSEVKKALESEGI